MADFTNPSAPAAETQAYRPTIATHRGLYFALRDAKVTSPRIDLTISSRDPRNADSFAQRNARVAVKNRYAAGHLGHISELALDPHYLPRTYCNEIYDVTCRDGEVFAQVDGARRAWVARGEASWFDAYGWVSHDIVMTECASCATDFMVSDLQEVEDGEVCGACFSSYYVRCAGRSLRVLQTDAHRINGEWHHADEVSICSGCGDAYVDESCESCESEPEAIVPGRVYRYHETDAATLPWGGSGPRYAGIEVEVATTDSSVSARTRAADQIGPSTVGEWTTLQRDSSIAGDGFEVISSPADLGAWRQRLTGEGATEWRRALKGLAGHAAQGCGMHVHVSRDAVPSRARAVLANFIRHDDNQAFIDLVAQRPANRYCVRELGSDHFNAINTEGEHTIEFRIFKSNTRPERVMKNIEFCYALIAWAETSPERHVWQAFAGWLATHQAEYPHLCAFLLERSIAVATYVELDEPETEVGLTDAPGEPDNGPSWSPEALLAAEREISRIRGDLFPLI